MEPLEAWVLHARPYRESSQLVELLTAEQGRIGVIARASRGVRRANPLSPFQCYRLVLGGRGELRRVQSSEGVGAPLLLAGHRLFAALYVNELLTRLLYRDVPVPGVFDLYGAALRALAAGEGLEAVLRRFEKQLLDDLGYGHRYAETADGEPVRADERYTFDPESGVRRAPPGFAAETYAGAALIALECGEFAAGELPDAKRLMRRALAPYLGARPLNSRALFRPVAVRGTPSGPESDLEEET